MQLEGEGGGGEGLYLCLCLGIVCVWSRARARARACDRYCNCDFGYVLSCAGAWCLHAQNMNCLVFIKLLQPSMDPLVIARKVFTDMVTTKTSRTRCVCVLLRCVDHWVFRV
jgi:hypothetical protein